MDDAEWSLDELDALADTAGADALERFVQQRDSPDPATYLGKGKVKEIVDIATALDADMLIFDDELTPAQGRNLEEMAGVNPLAEQRPEDHRPHRVDPRHLRPARALAPKGSCRSSSPS